MVHLSSYISNIVLSSVTDTPIEHGVVQAVTKTKLLFGSDYADLKAEDIIFAFENDPRLAKITMQDMTDVPVGKLAAKHGLVSSNC